MAARTQQWLTTRNTISNWLTNSQTVNATQGALNDQWQNAFSAHPLLISGIMGVGEYVLGGIEIIPNDGSPSSLWLGEQFGVKDFISSDPTDVPSLMHRDPHWITLPYDASILRGNMPNQVQITSGTSYVVNPQDLEVLIDVTNAFTVTVCNSMAWLAAQDNNQAPNLMIRDISNNIGPSNQITINFTSPDVANGSLTQLVIKNGYGGFTLRPIQAPAGQVATQGWMIQ